MARNIIAKSTAVVVLATLPCIGSAQEETSNVDDTIDEITVMGARSLALMRAEVAEAEQAVYDMFNELNDDDDYDIICKKETRIGSQIPRRVCLVRMYRERLAELTVDETQDSLLIVGTMTNSRKHQEILIEKMRALAKEHPELLDALRERYRLEAEFDAAREERYGE
jgi:hypothetical protein